MDSDIERSAPYAPAGSVIAVIRRFRERGLPQTLTGPELTRVGVSEGNASRTLQALRWLDLVDAEGHVSELFDRLRRASTEEYPGLLGDVIRHAYHQVFQIIDPTTASDVQIHDAFRYFSPQAQRSRMVILFTGLCKEAGIIEGDVLESRTPKRKPGTRSTNDSRAVRGAKTTRPLKSDAGAHILAQEALPGFQIVATSKQAVRSDDGHYALLAGLLRQLPDDHEWAATHRARWLAAFTASLDLLVETVEAAEKPHRSQGGFMIAGREEEG